MTARAGVILDPGPFSDRSPTIRRGLGVNALEINEANGIEDLLEHQQAIKQVHFAEKFHQLKQWQEEQKEKLIQEQQERMMLLRSQQEQLQRVLSEQRNKQWGGSTSLASPNTGQSPISPHAISPLTFDSSSPPERGQGSLRQRYDSNSLANLLQQAQVDILQHEENGSDLENAGSVEEDGFYPLPDTASEFSEGDGHHFEIEDNSHPAVTEQFPYHQFPLRQEQSSPTFGMTQSHKLNSNLSASNPHYRQGERSHRDSPSHHHVASRTDKDVEIFVQFEGDGLRDARQHIRGGTSLAIEDEERPIKSQLGSSVKSFEELLEAKLRSGNASEYVPQQSVSGKPKHPFLKKGVGLARFGKMKVPSPKTKKKQMGRLNLQQGGTGSSGGRNGKENAAPIGRSHNNNHVSNPPNTNNVFKKPIGQAPVSVLRKKLPSRENVTQQGPTAAGHILSNGQVNANADKMDTSFGMVQWEKNKELEEEDLAEFEMLEQAAEDNASFSSDNSLVVGVMQRVKQRGKTLLTSPLSRQRLPTLHSVDAAEDATEESHDRSDDHNELSDESGSGSDLNETLTKGTYGGNNRPTAKRKVTKGRSINDRFDSITNRHLTEGQNSKETEEELRRREGGSRRLDLEGHSDEQSIESDDDGDDDDSDESIDGLVTVIPNRLQSILTNGRGSLQDGQRTDRPLFERENKQTGTVLNFEISKDKQRYEEEEEHEESSKEQAGAAGYEFEDDETWGDFSANLSDSSSDSINVEGPSPVTKNKNGKSKSILDVTSGSVEQPEELIGSTPPPSHLVAKLFPQLKPKEKAKPNQDAMDSIQAARDRPLGDGLQAKVFKDKLAELENEIERFRKENTALSRLREEREKGLELFKKEVAEFERQKEAELKEIEEYRDKEMRKLRKEKKIFEKHQKTMRSLPDKKDREEIDQLKEQFSELQEELSRRESRWSANSRRLKDRVETLSNENKTLSEEVEAMNLKQQEDLAKGERKKAAARIRALREASKHKSLIPEFESGKFHSLPSNLPTASHKKMTKKKTFEEENFNKSSKDEIEDSSDSDSSESDDPRPAPSPQRGTIHHQTESPSSGFGDKEAFSSPQMTSEKDGESTEEQIHHPDGKVEVLQQDGSRVISFKNGTRKEISADGQLITVTFFNGDTRQIHPDQRVVYYYAETQITHTTYTDGLEIIHFPNNQTEKHYPDGTKEITFPDQTIKYLFQNGGEECVFPDGTVLRVAPGGDRTMEFPNGQREVHTAQYKKREYPDGTVKTVYPDGRQETRYAHGRLRVKDKDGRVLVDQQT